MPTSSFSTPPRSAMSTSLGAGRLRSRNGKFLHYENSPAHSETRWKLSEMVNPDGSVSVRRKVVNTDGSFSVVQEDYASMDQRILGNYDDLRYEERSLILDDVPSLTQSSPASTSTHSTPLLSPALSFDSFGRHSEGSAGSTFSAHWNKSLTDEDIQKNRVSRGSLEHIISSQASSPWDFNGVDVSAISVDSSLGYPMVDTSTVMQGNHGNGDYTDSETEWSLLRNEIDEPARIQPPKSKEASPTITGKPPLPHKERIETKGSLSLESPPRIKRSGLKRDGSLMQPQVKFYSDPGTPVSNDSSRDAKPLRNKGALFDMRSLNSNQSNLSGDLMIADLNEEVVYTVRKRTSEDKLGIHVGVRELASGPRLVVSEVRPEGKFAESPIEMGDIVVSINEVNFLRYPNSQEALDVVRSANDKVTFVVMKNRETLDTSSVDEFSLPSLPYEQVDQVVNQDGSRIKTREIANNDGSQTVVTEFFNPDGRKQKQTSQRRWLAFDGSSQDISLSSLTTNGEMIISVKKTLQSDTVGLRLENQRTHRGHNAIFVSQVFPSGLFARTPLSVGDVILSINDVDFSVKPNVQEASEAMSLSKVVKVVALKPVEWIEKRKLRISQARQLVETFTIDPPRSTAYHRFDDSSYDDSTFGYNSAKKVSLKDFSASERSGLSIASQYTKWGVLLFVKDIAASSRLANLGLHNGDVILSINGVDMKKEPDADRAMNLIRNSRDSIELEYQRLGNIAVSPSTTVPVARMESFRPDGTKSIRTETRNPDGSVVVRIEEVGPSNPIDAAVSDVGSANRSFADTSATSSVSIRNSSFLEAIASGVSDGQSSALEPVTVTVNKSKKSQDVGIHVTVISGSLFVTRVSKNGILFGKPILPGDTILDINGYDFRASPSTRRAQSILAKATKSITFTLLKTSLLASQAKKQGAAKSPQKGIIHRLTCRKRSTEEDEKNLARRQVANSSKQAQMKDDFSAAVGYV